MWTLHVEDFGRIESADIDVSPLTLFVGDNNSGKSYLLSLIYGLMRADDDNGVLLSNLCQDSPEYRKCADWMGAFFKEASGAETIEKPFDNYAYTAFENLFNRILQDNQKAILQSIFHENVSAGKISVTFRREENRIRFDRRAVEMSLSFGHGSVFWGDSFPTEENYSNFIWFTLSSMITQGIFYESIFFFPVARTGFLLTYPALAKDAFSRAYGVNGNRNANLSLSKPAADFLGNLTTVKKADVSKEYQPIIRFMENDILHGKISVSNKFPLPVFSYRPENMKTDIPMSLSSDVVKEVTPLILALQYQNADALFIEEPEMNLHPQLQQMMARVMIKLVNAGTPIFAATHSDTILQHINNMIKLNALPKKRQATLKKRFNFDKDDPISADKISMYQFDVKDNGRTEVQKLSCGKYGFEIPTFYAPLEALLQQTQDTEPGAEEYED